LGIDGHAHLAALDAGGRTVAVLPSPIDRVYPPRHRDLAARIVAEGGALVSESPPGRQSGKPDFARRNRIISGLSEATVVIEALGARSHLATSELASALTLLEARGLVASYGGVTFHATLAARRIGHPGSAR